jgi:hypothetical protein
LLRNAQKRDKNKKNIEQNKNNRGTKTKTEEKKAAFFVMSPDPRWTFSKKSFFRVFELPLLRITKRPKNALKQIDKK